MGRHPVFALPSGSFSDGHIWQLPAACSGGFKFRKQMEERKAEYEIY